MKEKERNPIISVLTISVGLMILFIVTKWHWLIMMALAIGLAGMFSISLSAKIDYVWMKLAWLLNLVSSKILLSIIFFLLLFPLAILSKIFGKKDPLYLRNKTNSLFIGCNKTFDKTSLEKPW